MNNNLEIIKSENFGRMKCDFYKNEEGEIFVTRTQIGKALEYSEPNTAITKIHNRNKERLDKFSVCTKLVGTDGKQYDTYLYNAKGVYEICRYSNQPKANDFYDWVYDVLDTIRKTGGYVANEDLFINTYLPFADDTTKQLFSNTLMTIRIQNEKIQEMKSKVDYFDELVDRRLLTNFRDTAKELKISPKQFNNFLLEKKYIYKDTKGKIKPYQSYKTQGLFELKEYFNKYNGHSDVQTMITPKGRETFRILFSEMEVA